jgi:threonine dehydrogenase-like Zn-dependent dehydrogenase
VTLDLGAAFHRRRIRIVSSQVSTLDPALGPRWDRERRTAVVIDLLGQLPLVDLVSHRFTFRDAASAYSMLDDQPEECLQVVLTYV